jgi:DNA-binding NtrC family response regulator
VYRHDRVGRPESKVAQAATKVARTARFGVGAGNMTSTLFRLSQTAPPAPTALVVEPLVPNLLSILSILTVLGFDSTVAETFKDARKALAAARPSLLITDIRLQDYNGLHLVLRGRGQWQGLPSVVTAQTGDEVLSREAERLGATFVTMPATTEELAAAICRTVFSARGENDAPIRPPFERRREERRRLSEATLVAAERRTGERRQARPMRADVARAHL